MSALPHFSITDPLPTGTVLLEASAGTGKTWTIAALVTRYVAEGVVLLPEMLVVTFGRAASQELRARVREQLVAAERALADPPPAGDRDDLLTLLLDVDEEERALRRRRLRTALSDIDAATIATTHQFCQQVLRSLGVAGTADADAELVDDLDRLLVEVVDDLYLRAFAQREDEPFFSRREALQIARTVVDDVHAELRPTGAEPRSVPDRRVRFARAVRHELGLRKERLQVMHYNDLLTQLADALAGEDSPARVRMRRRWKVVLVDEFQDTDPIQWSVLDRAFSGHAHAMVLIGDPKQAIYAFRGGDVPTYLMAADTAGDRRTLPRNFRSDPGVTQALGSMLTGAQLGDQQILVHPVTAHREGSRLAGPRAPLRCGCARCCCATTWAVTPGCRRCGRGSPATWRTTSPPCSPPGPPSRDARSRPGTWRSSPTAARTSSRRATPWPSWAYPPSPRGARPCCTAGRRTTGWRCSRRWSRRTDRCSPGRQPSPTCWGMPSPASASAASSRTPTSRTSWRRPAASWPGSTPGRGSPRCSSC
ncbi:UvrD-helicase domain-containing protein [Serinicoccus marinus]|uniref:UvrD-helicase domain-containing protein n=1 Tax=Serinicoccus marinus TaxID=247333 RepID=UPI0030B871DC